MKLKKIFHGHSGSIYSIHFLNSQQLISGGWDDKIYIWQIEAAKNPVCSQKAYLGQIRLMTIWQQQELLVLSGNDNKFITASLKTLTLNKVVRAHNQILTGLTVGNQQIVSASQDHSLKFWSADGSHLKTITFPAPIKKIAAQKNLTAVLLATNEIAIVDQNEYQIKLWLNKKIITQAPSEKVRATEEPSLKDLARRFNFCKKIWAIACDCKKQFLASGGADTVIRLWEIASDKIYKELIGHTGAVFGLAFHPQGKFLASCGEEGQIFIWDILSGKVLRILNEDCGPLFTLCFSGDGELLLAAGDRGIIFVWKLPAFRLVKKIEAAGKLFTLKELDQKTFIAGGDSGTATTFEV